MPDKIIIEMEPGMIEFLIQCVNTVQFTGKNNALRIIETDAHLRLAMDKSRMDKPISSKSEG